MADKDVLAGNIDVRDVLKKLEALGIVSASEYVRSVELGAEIVSGAGSMTINSLALEIEEREAGGGRSVTRQTGSGATVSRYGSDQSLESVVVTRYDQSGVGVTEYYDGHNRLIGKDVASNSTAANSVPTLAAATVGASIALAGFASAFTLSAQDADGGKLSFTAGAAAHGKVTSSGNGSFLYTSDPGFAGSDSFTATVSDGQGGTVVRTFNVSVTGSDRSSDWTLAATDGFHGQIGGSGIILGTQGRQDVTILDQAGTVTLDPSFNRGGDVARLSDKASTWQIVRSGSSAVLTDGDTGVVVPVSTSGVILDFDDGGRTVKFDAGSGVMKIGNQSFGASLVRVSAAADDFPPPASGGTDGTGKLFLDTGADVTAAGELLVFGSNGQDHTRFTEGRISLDGSFNAGGDVIELDAPTQAFTAVRLGSQITFASADLTISIPVGTKGAEIAFANGDHTLVYDSARQIVLLDSHVIGFEAAPLGAFG